MFANPAIAAMNRSDDRYSARCAAALIAGVSLALWSSLSLLAISLI